MKSRLLLLLAAGLVACGGERRGTATGAGMPAASATTSSPAAVDSLMARVIPAAAVALAMHSAPVGADSILAANNFTIDRYEATLYVIAADTVASQLFESALGR